MQIGNKIRFLRLDQNNNIWIGTEDQRVLFYHAAKDKFTEASEINNWFTGSDFQVSAMDIDKSNQVWIGTRDGLIKYDIDKKKVQRISNIDGLLGNDISAIYCDDQNQVWVGFDLKDGICRISQGEIKTYPFVSTITPSCMVKDYEGKLWIGTKGQGILIFQGDTITGNLEIGNGLLSNLINTLNVDKNNTLYIGTNKGLNVYDQQKEKIHTYSQKNGFIGIETNPAASYIDDKENIWFGTNKGVNKFNTKALRLELAGPFEVAEPLIYIESMYVNQEERAIAPNIKLKFYENHIRFNYTSICLTNSDAVRYRIMLEGVDDDWQEVTTQTSSTYQALPPNKYSFKVIARNSDGIWNSEPATHSFRIMIPPYKRWYFILSTVVLILIALTLYIKIRERNLVKEKRILEGKVKERTIKLEEANEELADRNKDITDSIRYAQRIQMSILPPEIPFDNTFVLFKPKDIVSGDFYWMTSVDSKEIIAAIDCTGHGVPGAFMSFIGYSSLNEVVKEKGITKPSSILDQLNEEVVMALNLKGQEGIKDGMDLALISYDKNTSELEYAGAYNPLYLLRSEELTEIKADRFAIGKSDETKKHFTNHSLKIEKGDTIYIFSDGYADQFGGENEKKFKTAPLKRLLISIQDKSMEEQKEILDRTIENWRGNIDQIDDILFIGRRF
jgi:serine phosphatase RsbU (regulator of sigma subunit)